MEALIPDLDEAARFLHILEPNGHFWFQTAREPKPAQGNAMARVLNGTFDERGQELARLNAMGSAIWVQVNAGRGRTDASVDRIRAYMVDIDEGSAEPLFAAAEPANIIVESSPGKFHGYWLTAEAPLDQFVQRMHLLADKFGGDHLICNLGRVMRLPGFFHLKDTNAPFMSRIVQVKGL